MLSSAFYLQKLDFLELDFLFLENLDLCSCRLPDRVLLILVPEAKDSLLAVDQVMSRFILEKIDTKETS